MWWISLNWCIEKYIDSELNFKQILRAWFKQLTHFLWKFLQNTFTENKKSRWAEIFKEVSPPPICHVSCVMCHVSHVTCHVSHVTYNFFLFFFFSNSLSLSWRVCYQRDYCFILVFVLFLNIKFFLLIFMFNL